MARQQHNNRNQKRSKSIAKEPIWVYGFHSVKACLEQGAENVIRILYARKDTEYLDIINEMQSIGINCEYVEAQAISQAVGNDIAHQSIAVCLKKAKSYNEKDLFSIIEAKQEANLPVLLLILDGVTDPRNLGACLRSANGAGVDAVVAPKNNASNITPITRKTASGAAETTPFVQITNLARLIKQLQDLGIEVVGTSDKTESNIYNYNFSSQVAIILGSEDKGIRALTAKSCDALVSIPMAGAVSSLNVSVASAVSLYEIVRQLKTG